MSQENADETKPQKPTYKTGWITAGTFMFVWVVIIFLTLERHGFIPLPLEKIQGTIVILDENGEVVPITRRLISVTFFSHYAPGPFRSEMGRNHDYFFALEGSDDFGSRIPKFPSTLFVQTYYGGKYAAVVDIARGEPMTGLVVTLRPRHFATGRLVDQSGTPIANHEFNLELMRVSEVAPYTRRVEYHTFETLWNRTNADGFFTVTRLIPGVKYNLCTYSPENGDGRGFSEITIPILEPEQYKQPFDLGDVVVR